MFIFLFPDSIFYKCRNCSWSRLYRSQIKSARLVVHVCTGKQVIPSICTKKRPEGQGLYIYSRMQGFGAGIKNFFKPSQLVFSPGVNMCFSNCDRQFIAL